MCKCIPALMLVDCFVFCFLRSLFAFFKARNNRRKREDLSHSFWYDLCQKYVSGKWKSESAFLCSEESGEAVSMQHQKTFNRALKKFRDGLLRNVFMKLNSKLFSIFYHIRLTPLFLHFAFCHLPF
jgi:hypothetical protein